MSACTSFSGSTASKRGAVPSASSCPEANDSPNEISFRAVLHRAAVVAHPQGAGGVGIPQRIQFGWRPSHSLLLTQVSDDADRLWLPPRSDPRDPAGDIGLVQPVLVAEAALERVLLDKRKVNCVSQEDHEQPARQCPGRKEQRLCCQQQQDARNHRVADVPIGALDDQRLWWVPGRRRALTHGGEQLAGPNG